MKQRSDGSAYRGRDAYVVRESRKSDAPYSVSFRYRKFGSVTLPTNTAYLRHHDDASTDCDPYNACVALQHKPFLIQVPYRGSAVHGSNFRVRCASDQRHRAASRGLKLLRGQEVGVSRGVLELHGAEAEVRLHLGGAADAVEQLGRRVDQLLWAVERRVALQPSPLESASASQTGKEGGSGEHVIQIVPGKGAFCHAGAG